MPSTSMTFTADTSPPRQNRGKLLARPAGGQVEVIANGRGDWIGWVELKKKPVDELATQHTARVVQDVNPDVIGFVEVESRPVLSDFSNIMIGQGGVAAFEHAMV